VKYRKVHDVTPEVTLFYIACSFVLSTKFVYLTIKVLYALWLVKIFLV